MSTSIDIAVADLKKKVDALERLVRRLVIAVVALVAAVAVGLVLVGLLFLQRGDARDYYNTQIKKLVCLVPPGKPVADQLRHQVGCGPYFPHNPASIRSAGRR